ncbi:hypothetical protein ACOMCU_00615 [Lysinibacillus sp. UGB7]|uniref:hypothetical protein n=1 Tax=Lysinibacillus sp. UGB7 TaxID=3411039 RepID=UPI003B79AF9E
MKHLRKKQIAKSYGFNYKKKRHRDVMHYFKKGGTTLGMYFVTDEDFLYTLKNFDKHPFGFTLPSRRKERSMK